MSKKTNFHPDALKRFDRKTGRKVGGRAQREYHLIVCEGQVTEPNYFNAIKKNYRLGLWRLKLKELAAIP